MLKSLIFGLHRCSIPGVAADHCCMLFLIPVDLFTSEQAGSDAQRNQIRCHLEDVTSEFLA